MIIKFHLAFALALCAFNASAEQRDARFAEPAEKEAGKRRARILQEIQTLTNHPWAAEYYYGDGTGVNVSVSIAPTNGYVFQWRGCLGVYDRNYGPVIETNGLVRLAFSFPNKREGFQGIAEEFVPVRWGERMYLVAFDGMISFCNDINSGSEPRNGIYGSHLLRNGDEKKKAPGLPDIPQKYRPYLLTKPIKAQIVKVGPSTLRPSRGNWKFKDTTVTLNAGAESGLLPGMKLHVFSPVDVFESVTIETVADNESVGVIKQFGGKERSPEVGWKVSTRRPGI